MSAEPIFESAILKVKRANHHINDLNASLSSIVTQRDFYRLSVQQNAGGQYFLTLESKPLPIAVAAIIGDAIHNLRSALDHVAYELVKRSGGTPSNDLYFPIKKTRSDVIGAVTQGEMKIAGQDICTLIIDTIQPHQGGNDPLWSLHQLDLIDKHRFLLPTVGVTSLKGVCAKGDGIEVNDVTIGVDAGGRFEFVGADWALSMNITNYGKPTLEVFLPKGTPLEGQPIIPTLVQLSEAVSTVIQQIKDALIRRT